jgi:hypothetical protein
MAIAWLGCSSCSTEDASGPRGPLDALPEEARTIKLTLWPFWEQYFDANDVLTPVPLGGVEVRVVKKRPYNGEWEDFVETDGPFTMTTENQKTILEDVPASSELIITASKEGYRPAARAVTTWHFDQDVTSWIGARDYYPLWLVRADFPSPVPPSVPVVPELGELVVSAVAYSPGNGGPGCGFLGGVDVVLDPSVDGTPFNTPRISKVQGIEFVAGTHLHASQSAQRPPVARREIMYLHTHLDAELVRVPGIFPDTIQVLAGPAVERTARSQRARHRGGEG